MTDLSLNHIRYSAQAFPAYRFIPGENPHPTESPQGHSFDAPSPPKVEVIADLWFVNETYLYGVDLYNHGFWWEAHEAWEALWRASKKDMYSKEFIQGLIKISGAMLKWYQKKSVGMEYLYSGGIEHLKKVCSKYEVYMGLDLMDHIAKLHEHFIMVMAPDDRVTFYKNFPYIQLEAKG